jgi:hypothetical protein
MSHYTIHDHVPTVLIDLDDTLADYEGYTSWRNIGPPREYAQDFVKEFKVHGWRTILWSVRSETGYIREWLEHYEFSDSEYGKGLVSDEGGNLTIDYINSNPMNAILGTNPAKPMCDLLVDNNAWPFCGMVVPLDVVMQNLLARRILQEGNTE